MSRSLIITLICATVLLCASGCSNKEEKKDGPPSPPAKAGDPQALVDTTWELGPYVVAFQPENKTLVTGRGVPIPGGVQGEYEASPDGIVRVSAAGQTHYGTWDGSILVMDGVTGVPVQAEPDNAEPITPPAQPNNSQSQAEGQST